MAVILMAAADASPPTAPHLKLAVPAAENWWTTCSGREARRIRRDRYGGLVDVGTRFERARDNCLATSAVVPIAALAEMA